MIFWPNFVCSLSFCDPPILSLDVDRQSPLTSFSFRQLPSNKDLSIVFMAPWISTYRSSVWCYWWGYEDKACQLKEERHAKPNSFAHKGETHQQQINVMTILMSWMTLITNFIKWEIKWGYLDSILLRQVFRQFNSTDPYNL